MEKEIFTLLVIGPLVLALWVLAIGAACLIGAEMMHHWKRRK
jgi:hypothetical protein